MKSAAAILLCLIVTCCAAQNGALLHRQALHFQLPDGADTVDFIVIDTALTSKKPVFLFCQGSLPVPLFVEIEGYGPYMLAGGVSNFDYANIREQYHLVVISMPHTPVYARKENINAQFHYVPDPAKPFEFSQAYLMADHLQNYVDRAGRVLAFLNHQPWVDPSKLVVAGHSQGSKVATKIAASHKGVTHLGLFAANPFGRVDQFVRQARLDAQMGRISWETADSVMNDHYRYFETAHHPDSLRAQPELKTWSSFSETFIDDWLGLDMPIYLAYGTEDRTADLCDLVPLFFTQAGKRNLTLRRYLRLEHNFFEVDEKGRPVYEKGHWEAVMRAFLEWAR